MNQILQTLRINKKILPYFAFSVFWISIYGRNILTPWIDGTDANTRLFYIHQTLVYVRGNPWLPGLQLLLQGIHTISDSPTIYKLLVGVFSFSSMILAFHLIFKNTHLIVAIVWSIGMFYSNKWQQVSTSLYMETPCFLFCLLAYFCAQKSKQISCLLCLIIASFFRPEIILISPLAALYYLINTKKIKLTVFYFSSIIPCVLFYLYIKLKSPYFLIPEYYDVKIAYHLATKLGYGIINTRAQQAYFLLSIFSFFVLFFDKNFLPFLRKKLLLLIPFILAFYLEFIFLLPALHSFSDGGTRPSLLVTIPLSLYAGIGAYYIYLKLSKFFKILFYILTLTLLISLPINTQPTSNWAYEVSKKINYLLINNKKAPLSYCLNKGMGGELHDTQYMPIIVHLRFLGWKPLLKTCDIQDQSTITLKFYKGNINNNEIKSCTHRVKIDKNMQVLGEVCLKLI